MNIEICGVDVGTALKLKEIAGDCTDLNDMGYNVKVTNITGLYYYISGIILEKGAKKILIRYNEYIHILIH